jgi:solute carrier family 25 protein 39/40
MASTQTSSTEKLISACSGAIVTSLMVTPMDVVKMRMQTHQYTPKRTICCQGIAPCALTHNFQHVAKKRPQRLATYQVANMHECALTQKNPLPFKGTLVTT